MYNLKRTVSSWIDGDGGDNKFVALHKIIKLLINNTSGPELLRCFFLCTYICTSGQFYCDMNNPIEPQKFRESCIGCNFCNRYTQYLSSS